MLKQRLVPIAWLLAATVVILALVAWWICLPAPLAELTIYEIFPLFGILAFSLMWTHYIIGTLRVHTGFDRSKLNLFYDSTAAVVLVCLLLHPGLIIWQAWRDGIGLPLNVVAPDLRFYVILGVIAWTVFLLFEFKEAYGKRSWWRYIERANEVAMLAILVHGFFLGRDCLPAWYMVLWVGYGFSFAIVTALNFVDRHHQTGNWL